MSKEERSSNLLSSDTNCMTHRQVLEVVAVKLSTLSATESSTVLRTR